MTAAFTISIRQLPKLTPLFQYWNPSQFDHWYTKDPIEIGTITPGQPGIDEYNNSLSEGICCFIARNKIKDTVPLGYYYSASKNDSLYTIDPYKVFGEHDGPKPGREYGSNKYTYKGIVGYVYKESQENTVPLRSFVYYRNNRVDHFYSCLSDNANDVLNNQYADHYTLQERIEGHVYKAPVVD